MKNFKNMKMWAFLLPIVAVVITFTSCEEEFTQEEQQLLVSKSMNKEQKKAVPIKGEYTTTGNILVGPPIVQQEITGFGQSSHLGKSTFVAYSTLNLTTPPPFQLSGTATFTSANGDAFYTSFTGTATPNGQGANNVVMTHTITGGTGRFESATGSFVGSTVAVPGHTEGVITYEGTISY
jgi:hypothetical protein